MPFSGESGERRAFRPASVRGEHAEPILASITSTPIDWIGQHGAYAIFAVMAVDALVPVGGELTMLFAGALAAGAIAGRQPVLFGHALTPGLQSYVVLALAGTLGYLAGALAGWAIGRRGGRPLLERHGRWLGVTPADLDRAESWFDRHGRAAVFLGRLTPLVRSFVSIPAGVLESPLRAYTLLTLAGSAIWCFAFAGAGWALGSSYDSVHHAFRYVDVLVVVALVAAVAARATLHRRTRASRAPAAACVVALGVAGCGHAAPPRSTVPARAPRAHRPPLRRLALRVVRRAALPAAVQLPGVARVGRAVLVAGGLDAADRSVADVVRAAPAPAARVGALPGAVHDAPAATLGSTAYVLGGGTAAGPSDAIDGRTRRAGSLPLGLSDAAAASHGRTAWVVGGFTATTPLRSVLAFRPGRRVRHVASLPHPLRYAAAAAVGGAVLVAGGIDGTTARDEILRVDPRTGRVRVVGHLPAPLAHAAGVALGRTFYVLGGRSDAPDGQRRAIWAVDPESGHVRRAGRLPVALSDLAAVTVGRRLLVAGGRDRAGRVHGELLELASR